MFTPRKIAIVGCPGSGKTTLANKIGSILNIPVYHLDKIFWVEKGGITQDNFIAQQEEMMKGAQWIIDGNYMKSKSFDMRLSAADMIIYFEFSKLVIYWRLLWRRIKYHRRPRYDMPENHKEQLHWNLIKFIWKYPTKEIREKVLGYSNNKKVVILRNEREEKTFLNSLKP